MADLPRGTVTFLFTDIEGSTRLLTRLGDPYAEVLAEHHRVLRSVFDEHGGREVHTEGDAFFVAFWRASDAVAAAVSAQRALASVRWPATVAVRVRMGVHTGEAAVRAGDYVGLDVHRAARICAAGHGGQVLVSASTRAVVTSRHDDPVAWRDLGEHRLKDLPEPEHLFQVVAEGLTEDFPPLKSLDTSPTNLPAQLTPLVGRRRELAELGALLESDRGRLVTLTGPGGSGKSRLSLSVAGEWRELHAGWVHVVGLAPVGDASLAAAAIVDALGLRSDAGEPATELLRRRLADQRALLVLDNFEHLLPAAPLVAELLGTCPRLQVLVTSRAPLRLTGEQEYEVLPLPYPDAAALFVERARGVRGIFALDASGERAIAEICARLDGLPLAIELAAVRTKLLSPVALLARLQSPLGLLTSGARDRPVRQQTMRATIDWSFRLLGRQEQDVLAALSIFAGGWSLDAAEEVAGASIDILGALLDASLIRQRELTDGEPRFGVLETIRQFAHEQLVESGHEDDVAHRHAAFFLGLAREMVAEPCGPSFEPGLALVEREHDNVRGALGWAIEHEPLLAIDLAGSLVWFWDTRGHLTEGQRWLERALAGAANAPPRARARACFGLLRLANSQWQEPHLHAAAEEALHLYRELDDAAGVAITLSHLAQVQEVGGDLDGAIATSEQALAIARTVPEDRWTLSVALNNSAVELIAAGELVGARARLEESLALRRSMHDTRGIAVALENLGEVALASGDLETAQAISDECASAARAIGYRLILARALIHGAIVALLRGGNARAAKSLAEALEHARDIGDTQSLSDALKVVAVLAAQREQTGLAAQLWAAAAQEASYSPAYEPMLARELEADIATTTPTELNTTRAAGTASSLREATQLAEQMLRDLRTGSAPIANPPAATLATSQERS